MTPGTSILLHGTVERVVGSHIAARVGDGLVIVVEHDIAHPLPEIVTWAGHVWTVVGRAAGWVCIARGRVALPVPEKWINNGEGQA